MATATNAGYRLCNAARIKKIRIFVAPGYNSGYQNSAWFQWSGEDSPSKLIDLSAQTGQYGCYVETTPPKNSLAAFWSNVGYDESTPLFVCAFIGGATLDVTIEYTLMNTITGVTASAATNTISGATIGDVLYAPLDNKSGGKLTASSQNAT
jgi:hypothetical protein